jgi:Fic family protein
MMTFRQFSHGLEMIPTSTSWHLADLGEARGKQELFTRQSPQRLKSLREHALIESAVSSNRIEGVEVDQKRIGTLMFGKAALKDRDEEEVRGYRDALNLIHTRVVRLPIDERTIRQLHQMTRGEIWDAGKYKKKDGDIIEKYSDGRQRVRFRPTSAANTSAAMAELVALREQCLEERWAHPLVALGAFCLDFLCIHPFRDGNGRVSRLLMVLGCYHAGLEVGRYVSLERLIEENKQRYYETLERCSQGWHAEKHDPWPFINYVLWILKSAYAEFEQRVGETSEPRGTKSVMIRHAVARQSDEFRLSDIERACPSVGREWIRATLAEMRKAGEVRCVGRGPGARWRNKGTTLK